MVTLKEQFDEQNRQWQRFHEWESTQPREDRDAGRIIADIGAILQWMPVEARQFDPDPEKLGVQAMHAALSKLSPGR
jgi:hypothetical protein